MYKIVLVTDNYYKFIIWMRKFVMVDSDPRIPSWIRYFLIFRVPVTALIRYMLYGLKTGFVYYLFVFLKMSFLA